MTTQENKDSKRSISTITRIVSIGIVIASLAAFGWVASNAFQATDNLSNVRWTPFAGAIALQFVMLFVLMFIWERLLGFLWIPRSQAEIPSRSGLYTSYSRSWLARYIPGRVWALGGRALLANKQGVPMEAVGRSMALEVIFSYGIVTVIGAALLLSGQFNVFAGLPVLIIGLIAFAAALLFAQKVLASLLSKDVQNAFWSQMMQRAQRIVVGDKSLTLGNTVWGVIVYGIYGLMQLGFIVLIAASFTDLTIAHAAIIAGAWGVSLTLGWLSFLAPVGLGVRDGLAFFLFGQVMDAPTAGVIVATSRVVMIAADLVFVGAVELLAVGMGFKQTRVYETGRVSDLGKSSLQSE